MDPCVDVDELVDVIVSAKEVDVLLIVEGGLVAVECAPLGGGRRVGLRGPL